MKICDSTSHSVKKDKWSKFFFELKLHYPQLKNNRLYCDFIIGIITDSTVDIITVIFFLIIH